MKNPIRVALSGSGFRLCAHIGSLQAIEDAGYEIREMAGTSGGAVIAALYASGIPLDVLSEICLSLDWSPMMGFSLSALLKNQSLCSGNKLLAYLHGLTDGKTFSDLSIDLKIVAADLLTEKEFIFSGEATPSAPLALAARASASIPVVYAPVAYGDAILVDGGCCDNLPADHLTVDSLPRIGIYLASNDAPLLPGVYGLKTLAPRIIDLLLASSENAVVNLSEKSGAHIVYIPTGFASSFDRKMPLSVRKQLYDVGYATTTKYLKTMVVAK